MAYKLQLRRDTAANWTSVNPTLGQGEPGLELDTGKIKYGDGTTAWNSLAYGGSAASATTATNVSGGTAGQLHYQSAPGITGFVGPGTSGQLLVSAGTSAPVYTNTSSVQVGFAVTASALLSGATLTVNNSTAATSTNTGALQIVNGGAGIGGSLYVGGSIMPGNAAVDLGSLANPFRDLYLTSGTLYIGAASVRSSGSTITVSGSPVVTTSTLATSIAAAASSTGGITATNILSGTAGQIIYQSAPSTTGFVGPGTAGQLLVSAGAAAPAYTSTGSIYVNSAVYAEELRGGTAGQLVYQSAANTTDYVGPGTAGQILVSAGAAVPVYTSTGSLYVGNAATANVLNAGNTATQQVGFAANVLGGAAGSIHYQTAANATGMLSLGTAGQILIAGSSAPVYTSTGSVYVGFSNKSNNIIGGTAGQLVYNSGVDATSFVGPGTAGQLLVSGGAAAPVYTNTGSIYVNSAVNSNNIIGGVANQIPYQTAAGATTFNSGLTFNGTTFTATNIVVPGTTAASSTATGALTVVGGVGVGGGLFVGGVITATNVYVNGYAVSTASSLTIQSGGVGQGTAATINFSTGLSASVATNVATVTLTTSTLMTTAVNLGGGTTGQLHYQTGAGATGFTGPGTAGQILVSAGTSAPVYTNTGSIYVNSAVYAEELRGGTAGQLVYQSAANVSDFAGPGTAGQLLVSAGAAAPVYTSTGSIYVGNAAVANILNAGNTSTQQVGYAANDLGGAAGSLRYQSGANASTFLSIGGASSILTSNGSVPSWSTSPTIGGDLTITGNLTVQGTTTAVNSTVTNVSDPIITLGGGAGGIAPASNDGKDRGIAFQWHNGTTAKIGFFGYKNSTGKFTFIPDSTNANEVVSGTKGAIDANLAGGTAGQLVYQSAADTTAFVGPGTAGQILVSAGTSAPVYTNTGSIQVGYSANTLGGAAGSLPYQTAANTTGMLSLGTAGQILTAGGSAPQYTSTGSVYVGFSNKANNVIGGTAGQLVYNSGVDTTAFVGPGTAGQILVSAGAAAPVYTNTGSIYVNRAVTADSATGSAGSVTNSLTAGTGLTGTAFNGSAAQTWTLNTATLMATAVTAFTANSVAGSNVSGNISGNAANVTGIVALANGGSGQSTAQAAMNAFAGATTSGSYLRGNGTNVVMSTIQAGDVPTLNQNTTGSAGSVTNSLTAGTGLTGTAFNGSAAQTWTLNTATYMASAALATSASKVTNAHTAGTGLTGTAFDGSAAQTWTLNTATLMATAVTALNGGVTSIVAGTAISVSGATGAVTVNNTGVTSNVAGTGVSVSGATGAVTISIGQAVGTTASVTFGSMNLGSATGATTGQLNASGEITAFSSDRRLKTNIRPIDNAVSKVLKLNGIIYNWNELANQLVGYDTKQDIAGLFAQDVKEVLPEAVKPAPFDNDGAGASKSGENYLTIQYEKLIPLLVEAIKDQQQQISELHDLVNTLSKQ